MLAFSDVLPYLVIAFIVLFAGALIYEARRQRSTQQRTYRRYAHSKGRRFCESDDGTAQQMADGLEAVGIFHSPSLGPVLPKNVISGHVPEGNICLFTHSLRRQAGENHPFHVCIVKTDRSIEHGVVVRFTQGKTSRQNPFYRGSLIPVPNGLESRLIVYARNGGFPKELHSKEILLSLLREAESLPWRLDLQAVGHRVAVYTTERNMKPIDPEGLERLEAFTRSAAGRLHSESNAV